ncbi:MAG: ribosomal protein S18-alanine N-acetyltransferase, partial [Mariprofundaceae bacterium]
MAAKKSDASPLGSTMYQPRLQAIRPADTGDIYAVYQLNCAAFSEAWSVMALGMWQQRGDDLDVCYDENNRLAAYYLGQDVLDEVHIMQIAVAPEFRRTGLGKRLMQYEIEHKCAKGMATMHLEVRASNLAAQALYQSLGFTTVGTRPNYYSPIPDKPLGEDAVLM